MGSKNIQSCQAAIAFATCVSSSGHLQSFFFFFYAAQNSPCSSFFKTRISFSSAFQVHIWETIIRWAEKGCWMNHKRWSIICQTFAGCTILGILCSGSVTWRGFIHDLKQLNERNTVRTHGFTSPVSSWVFPSPPKNHTPPTPATTTRWHKTNRK